MTTPHGHPDYQAIVNASSANILGGPATVFPVGHTLTPVIPVANWGSLLLSVQPSAGFAKVFLRHWQDAAGTISLGNDNWAVNTGTGLAVRAPLRGPYVQIDVDVTSAGAMTANASALFQSTTASELTFPVGWQGATDQGHVLAASANKGYAPAFIAAGRAWLMFQPADATGKLQVVLYGTDETGTAYGILYINVAPAAPVYQLLELPDTPLFLQVLNNDGAAPHTYTISLIIPPQ